MPAKDRRIDAFIAKAQPFARPILKRLRRAVHRGCPKVDETIKWGVPHFMHHGMLCGMAAFKNHCAFGFWRGKELIKRDARFAALRGPTGGYSCLVRVTDLPSDARLTTLVRIAAKFNQDGPPPKRAKSKPRPPPRVPADLKAALAKDAKARKHFAAFPPSAKREYTDWIATAKRPETRARRLATTLKQLRANRRQNWEYATR